MCSFCHKHGHNVRSCPQLATKLLKAVQTKHSAKQILEVVSQDTVTVHGVRHKATSSMRSMMKCVHKGSRAMSSSRTQTSSKNRSANERRRLPKRKTFDQEKMDSAMRSDFLKAWKFLTRWGFAQPGLRSRHTRYPCSCKRSGCVAEKLSMGPPRSSQRKKLVEPLKKEKRKLTTVYFRGSKCSKFFPCTKFTGLPQVKFPFPLPMLTQFIQRFMQMHQPNLLSLCQEVGMSRSRGDMRLCSWLHQHEAAAGYDAMRKLKLHGQMEGDGTGTALRLFRYDNKNHCLHLRQIIQHPGTGQT